MICWHCEKELELSYQTSDFALKVYHCEDCDSWYELRKQKPRLNAAVPVMVTEIDPPIDTVQQAA